MTRMKSANSRSNDDRLQEEMVEVLAAKSEKERLQIAWGMWNSARRMLVRIVRSEHSDWSTDRIEAEVSKRMSGDTR